jgi:hypothetical protein
MTPIPMLAITVSVGLFGIGIERPGGVKAFLMFFLRLAFRGGPVKPDLSHPRSWLGSGLAVMLHARDQALRSAGLSPCRPAPG